MSALGFEIRGSRLVDLKESMCWWGIGKLAWPFVTMALEWMAVASLPKLWRVWKRGAMQERVCCASSSQSRLSSDRHNLVVAEREMHVSTECKMGRRCFQWTQLSHR